MMTYRCGRNTIDIRLVVNEGQFLETWIRLKVNLNLRRT